MKKLYISIAVAVVVAGAGGFYGGMKYQQKKIPSFGNLSQAQRQQFQANGNRTGRPGGVNGANFANGSIISRDDKSITVQLPNNGGSKIVFLSDKSAILKSTDGTPADLTVGENVTINGTSNSDGSLTAQSISIRPQLPAGQGQ